MKIYKQSLILSKAAIADNKSLLFRIISHSCIPHTCVLSNITGGQEITRAEGGENETDKRKWSP